MSGETAHSATFPAPGRKTLLERVLALRQGTVLIIGDVMLDTYLSGEAERISPEAPVPVVRIEEESHVLGGAGNVARNIAALGGAALLLGARGADAAGEKLTALLEACRIKAVLHVHAARPTTVKSRILARGQQMLRFDREQTTRFGKDEHEALLAAAAELLPGCGAVVISDYSKGLVTPFFMRELQALIQALPAPVPLLVDPKPENMEAYAGVTLLTPNARETGEATHLPLRTRQEIVAAGRAMMERLGCDHLVTTLGAEGMAVFEDRQVIRHIPTMARKVFDVTGAGDTVIAAIALALATGAPLLEACILANYAAGVVVGEIGAATCNGEQLTRAVNETVNLLIENWA